jgi:hypothetical protein
MSFQKDGGCQCEGIRYRISAAPVRVGICHCTQCQKATGGAFSISMIVPSDAFTLLRGQLKTWTRTSESGRPVLCSFCPDCGTRIAHNTELYRGFTNVRPGTLDDRSWLQPTISVWTREKQPWVHVPEHLVQYETQP